MLSIGPESKTSAPSRGFCAKEPWHLSSIKLGCWDTPVSTPGNDTISPSALRAARPNPKLYGVGQIAAIRDRQHGLGDPVPVLHVGIFSGY